MALSTAAFAFVLALAGCAKRPVPCAGPTCSEGFECLANRCIPAGTDPVDSQTERFVLRPEHVAVVTRQRPADRGLPMTVALGDVSTGAVTVLLDFEDTWKQPMYIDAAFLLLDPVPATGVGDDVEVSVWRVNGSWHPKEVSWATQPRLGIPRAKGIARSAPPTTLRIDVTHVVRFLREQSTDHGLALTAGKGHTRGATYWTGTGGGRGPRLELYVRDCGPGGECSPDGP